MLKYKLNSYYNIADYDSDYVKHYLNSIGISKVTSFMDYPRDEDELDPYLLNNMEAGLEMFDKHIKRDSKIFILVDSDPDGFTSGSIIYNYIKNINKDVEISHFLHTGKEHGIEENMEIPDVDLVIVPDAGSNQLEELNAIADRNIDILVLDHHEVDVVVDNPRVIIINNQQSDQFINKSLSGAGVVFKFVQAYDCDYRNDCFWEKYYDLAMLGIVADVMYSGTLDNNYIITKGLSNIHNKFMKALLEKQSFSVSSSTEPNKIDIAFYIVPVINGVIRIGTQEEKENLFRAMANNDIIEYVDTTFRGADRHETFYEYVARESTNIKARQDALIKKVTENIFEKIESQGLQNNQLIIYKTSLTNPNEVPKTLTGLVAMKICAKYNRCTLVLRPQMVDGVQYYMGSGRGKIAEGFDSLKDFLVDSGLVTMAQGHAMAHGCSMTEDNIDKLVEYANLKLADIDFGSDMVEVCGINPPYNAMMEFAMYPRLYGNGIPQPTVAYTRFIKDYIIMGARQDTIKIEFDGITFIKFHAKELIEELKSKAPCNMVIIGRPQLNEFRGFKNLQIIIDNYELQEYQLI